MAFGDSTRPWNYFGDFPIRLVGCVDSHYCIENITG
jgi:hypothetical protein